MQRYAVTLVGVGLSVVIYLLSVTFDIDLFERVVTFLEEVDHLELDEILLCGVIILVFASFDILRRRRAIEVAEEKAKIYRAMMFGVHHILNNFLNQMQLFRMTAENTPGFDGEILELYDRVILETKTQIEAIGSVSAVDDEEIRKSVLPD